MKYLLYIFTLCFIQISIPAQSQYFDLHYTIKPYVELENPIVLCQDSIGLRHHFTLDVPMEILGEEVDSLYIFNWSNLHLALGNKKSKECDLFVPINTALLREVNASDSIGFSISYEITGEIGNRLIKVQWKDVKPKKTYKPNDVFNVQMIIDETDQSVSYHFGPMPEYFNTFFSLFLQSRILALYFIDDFKSFDAPKNEIYAIGQSFLDKTKLDLTKHIILDGTFSDESYSSAMHYDYPNATLNSGQFFKIFLFSTSTNDQFSHETPIIYPNPAHDNLYLRNNDTEFTEYEIMDRLGAIIQKGKVNDFTINIEQLSPGLHLLKLGTARGEERINKFVKL